MVLADWFVPGYKAGGPIRSCLHFVQLMKEDYDCFVFTTDRDLNEAAPYKGIAIDQWSDFDPRVRIFYCSPEQLSWKNILSQVRSLNPDYIYLNSMYSKYFAVYPLLMKRFGFIGQKLVLSPRGMLKSSALQFRKSKKKIYLSVIRWLGMHKLVHFHATDETEQKDIYKQFGENVTVTLAPNPAGHVTEYRGSITKVRQELSVIFVGRIHPIKNLHYLLELLSSVSGNIRVTVVGNEEDRQYAELCKSLVKNFPERIAVSFAGELPNQQLPEVMHQHHIFALPTQGENFGHAIFEALSQGKPALISDQTPWQHLTEKKAGWAIPLGEKQHFQKALQQAIDFDQEEYDQWSKGAWKTAAAFANKTELKELYFNIFS